MRLINAGKVVNNFKIEFETPQYEENESPGQDNVAINRDFKYAILSHTWGWPDRDTGKWAHRVDEVTYKGRHEFSDPFDILFLSLDKQTAYRKVYYTCLWAITLGCDYVWIDSCCIDKSNSAELNESINSMFRWYSEADVCIVYLVDSCNQGTIRDNVKLDPWRRLYYKDNVPCRWFDRCWTLQELLASRKLEFFDNNWVPIGTLQKEGTENLDEFGNEIRVITKVDAKALLGKVPLWEHSVEAKMSWAVDRNSSRPEDVAYSLLGLFDVQMPLIYGEGARSAFQRLQLEIVKSTPDLSILAWHTGKRAQEGQFCSVLAQSPSQFRFNRRICRLIPQTHHTFTNKGLQMTSILHRVQTSQRERYFLCLEDQKEANTAIGIFLLKISYNAFQRAEESLASISNLEKYPSTHISTFYILSSRLQNPETMSPGYGSFRVPLDCTVLDVLPEACWDCENRVLLGNMPCNDGVRVLKLSINIRGGRSRVIALLFRSSSYTAFSCEKDAVSTKKLFTRTHRREFMTWDEMMAKIPEIANRRGEIGIEDVASLSSKIFPQVHSPQKGSFKFVDISAISTGLAEIEIPVEQSEPKKKLMIRDGPTSVYRHSVDTAI